MQPCTSTRRRLTILYSIFFLNCIIDIKEWFLNINIVQTVAQLGMPLGGQSRARVDL